MSNNTIATVAEVCAQNGYVVGRDLKRLMEDAAGSVKAFADANGLARAQCYRLTSENQQPRHALPHVLHIFLAVYHPDKWAQMRELLNPKPTDPKD